MLEEAVLTVDVDGAVVTEIKGGVSIGVVVSACLKEIGDDRTQELTDCRLYSTMVTGILAC